MARHALALPRHPLSSALVWVARDRKLWSYHGFNNHADVMDKNREYFEYLQNRSWRGRFYRKFFLYPRINRLLKGKLLDVGCGVGDMLACRPNSIGVDVNAKFCRWRGLDAREMPYDVLPFDDASFDSILLDNVLEHIADPTPLLNEIKRVMRPDGVLLIGVPGLRGQLYDLDHKVYYDEPNLSALANRLGFEVVDSLYTPLWKSVMFSQMIKSYCLYSQWQLVSKGI